MTASGAFVSHSPISMGQPSAINPTVSNGIVTGNIGQGPCLGDVDCRRKCTLTGIIYLAPVKLFCTLATRVCELLVNWQVILALFIIGSQIVAHVNLDA